MSTLLVMTSQASSYVPDAPQRLRYHRQELFQESALRHQMPTPPEVPLERIFHL